MLIKEICLLIELWLQILRASIVIEILLKSNVEIDGTTHSNTLAVATHAVNKNFGSLIQQVFTDSSLDNLTDADTIQKRKSPYG